MALKNNKSKGKIILLVTAIFMTISFIGLLTFLSSRFETTTYYVLKTNVPTRTKIVPELLEPVVTNKGTAPATALGIADVQEGSVFTQYPLNKGDILTASNTTGFQNISVGVPDDYVITSFSVGADNAVQGRIRRGTYFDMMVASADGSFYPFVNILCLDTTVSLSGASNNNAVNTEEAHAGQTSQYTVGMKPGDAAILQNIVASHGGDIRLVLSPIQNAYNPPQIADYTGKFAFGMRDEDLVDKEMYTPSNQGIGTDFTFKPVKRDEFGRPLPVKPDCSRGNYKLGEKRCKKIEEKLKKEGKTLDEYLDSLDKAAKEGKVDEGSNAEGKKVDMGKNADKNDVDNVDDTPVDDMPEDVSSDNASDKEAQ